MFDVRHQEGVVAADVACGEWARRVALPFLESMVPAFTALAQTPAQAAAALRRRLLPERRADGIPTTTGCRRRPGELEITPILKPLEPFRDQMTVVGNLSRAGGKTVTDHAVSSAGWLSGAVAKQTEAEDIQRRHHASIRCWRKQIGQDTPFPSLEFATEDFSGYVGGCVPGYSCTYMNTISWAGGDRRRCRWRSIRAWRSSGCSAAPATPAERAARGCARTAASSIRSPARRAQLQRRLGAQDRARLDDYLDNVREIERRIQKTEARNATERDRASTAPVGVPETFEEHAALMFDLLAVAYQADLTRVFTFMMAREASQRTYPGARTFRRRTTTSRTTAARPTRWSSTRRSTRTSRRCSRRSSRSCGKSPEGDGSVLDHSLIVFGAGMSDGQAHNAYPLPLAAVGGAGGRIKGNRFIVAPEWTPVANFWLERGRHVRQPDSSSFGESTGRVEL